MLRLQVAAALLERLVDRRLRSAHDLGASHFAVLETVGFAGPCRQRVLADRLGVSRASITMRIAVLRDRGLVRTDPDPEDARSVLVSLTHAGTDLLRVAVRTVATVAEEVDEGVDVRSLGRAVDAVSANARRALRRRREAA